MPDLNQIVRFSGPVAEWPIKSPSGRIRGSDIGAIRLPDGSLKWVLHPIISPGRHAAGPLTDVMPAGSIMHLQGFYAVTGAAVEPQSKMLVWQDNDAAGDPAPVGIDAAAHPGAYLPVFADGVAPTLSDYLRVVELATDRLFATVNPSRLAAETYRDTGDGRAVLIDQGNLDPEGKLDYAALGVVEVPVSSAIGDAAPLSERGLPGPRSRSIIYHQTGDGACTYYRTVADLRSSWARLLDESEDEVLLETGRISTQEFRSFDSEPGGAPPDGQSEPQSFGEVESEVYFRQQWELPAGTPISANSVFASPDGRLWNVLSVTRSQDDDRRLTANVARKQRGQAARPELIRRAA